MILDDLVLQNLGKPVEREDPSNYAQCMDWAFAYCDALGIPREAIRHLHAFEVWTLASDVTKKYFDLIPNTASFVPQKGDLVIFGTAVGVSGHICIASGNNSGTQTFQSTDENWSGHAYIEYIWHNYGPQTGDKRGVLGVLRPKVQPASSTTVDGATFAKLVHNSGVSDQLNSYLGLPANSDWALIQPKLDALKPTISRRAELEQIRDTAIKALS